MVEITVIPDAVHALELLGEAADSALWLWPARLFDWEMRS